MTCTRTVGNGLKPPAHANVRKLQGAYLIELDVADFTESEVAVEVFGRQLMIRGDQIETSDDDGKAFRLHERLEESFRLPDDADVQRIKVFYKHGTLEIHVPRMHLKPQQLPIEHQTDRFNPNAEAC
jgi:HSP20 family molecular chaperone IbpA